MSARRLNTSRRSTTSPPMSGGVSRVLHMSSTSSSPAKPEGDVPELRSLGPQFDKQLHGRHADVLLKVLSDQSASGPNWVCPNWLALRWPASTAP